MQAKEPDRHLLHFETALQALRSGDKKTATTYLTLSVAGCPTVAAYVELAKIYFEDKKIDKAYGIVTQAQDLCKNQQDDALKAIAIKVETEWLAARPEREAIAALDLAIYCIDADWEKFNSAKSPEAIHECITHLGGDGWRLTVGEVIDRIEKNVNRYYVPLAKHSFVRVVNGPNGKYLRAVVTDCFLNDVYCDNLLVLGECISDDNDEALENFQRCTSDDRNEVLENFRLLEKELQRKELATNLGPPELITIDHDDYHAEYIGLTKDNFQFFMTSLFVPGADEFLAVFLFNESGDLVESKVDHLGTRETMDIEAARQLRSNRLSELGVKEFTTIKVKPFAVEHYGITMGLIPEKFEDNWTVELLPGNCMAFYAPWDSGIYDT